MLLPRQTLFAPRTHALTRSPGVRSVKDCFPSARSPCPSVVIRAVCGWRKPCGLWPSPPFPTPTLSISTLGRQVVTSQGTCRLATIPGSRHPPSRLWCPLCRNCIVKKLCCPCVRISMYPPSRTRTVPPSLLVYSTSTRGDAVRVSPTKSAPRRVLTLTLATRSFNIHGASCTSICHRFSRLCLGDPCN